MPRSMMRSAPSMRRRSPSCRSPLAMSVRDKRFQWLGPLRISPNSPLAGSACGVRSAWRFSVRRDVGAVSNGDLGRLCGGARWQVLHVLDAETVLLRSDTGQELAADPVRIRLPDGPAPSDGSPARIPAPQRPGRGCRSTARPATFACVTVPAWSDSVTDHGQEYVTELACGALPGANPANAADRLYAVTLEAWRHREAFARWKARARRQRRDTTHRKVRSYAAAALP